MKLPPAVAIPLTGWDTRKSFTGLQVPTLVVGSENDTIAPVRSHSIPFYNSIPAATEKEYIEINNGSHFTPNSPNTRF